MKKYLRICRIDNIPKQIFIVPGIFLASLYTSIDNINFWYIILGFICAILSASSNYVINEYLDRKVRLDPLQKRFYQHRVQLLTNHINEYLDTEENK